MDIGRVIGTVVANTRYPGTEGVRLLVVQPLDDELAPHGAPIVASDAVQSGPGDYVFFANSREASMAFEQNFVPVDAAIVGFLDAVGDEVLDHDGPVEHNAPDLPERSSS
jgi:ethanolamine utilization protein EutN